jgi:hypothetical protein
MLMIRAACDLVQVPERLTFDLRNSGPAAPPSSVARSMS